MSIEMVSPSLMSPMGPCLRADVSDGSSAACAGETSVSDEGYCLVQFHACEGRGGIEHLSHTGTALRTFVADDDYIAVNYLTVIYRLDGVVFGIENSGGSFMLEHLGSNGGSLDYSAFGSDISPKNCDAACS